jgi:GTP-binding protein
VKRGERDCLVVDTGGISDEGDGIDAFSRKQVDIALQEADVIFFLVDARDGLNASDEMIAESLRKLAKPVVLVINKMDGINSDTVTHDFYSLALGEPIPIAATHGRNIHELLERIDELLPVTDDDIEEQEKGIAIAIVGRPNVGKSTLVNRLLGEERVVVFDEAGTTRDSIYIPFERNGQKFTLIDTAGMRRRAKVSLLVEKFSIIKSLQAIEKSHVVIYLIDAVEGVTDQDAHILGLILEAGRALIIGLNKWDGLNAEHREFVKKQIDIKLAFLEYAEKHPISALHGSGVGKLFDTVHSLYDSAMIDMSTPLLTRILNDALAAHQPPLVSGHRIKLKYAHQGGRNPPIVVIHGVQTDALPGAYIRYLMNYYREQLQLKGTQVRLVFKSPANPFEGQKNKLTEHQQKKRRRLVTYRKSQKKT